MVDPRGNRGDALPGPEQTCYEDIWGPGKDGMWQSASVRRPLVRVGQRRMEREMQRRGEEEAGRSEEEEDDYEEVR